MNDTPSAWSSGYVHRATLACTSCDGSGMVDDYVCGACFGVGTYTVICGSPAEVDSEHPGLGAYCLREDRTVPLEEVSVGEYLDPRRE